MEIVGPEPCPLPRHPGLAEVARALNDAATWGIVVDREWRLVYMTDEIRRSNGADRELVPLPLGADYFGSEALETMFGWSGKVWSVPAVRGFLAAVAPWMLTDVPGGREAVRERLAPELRDVVDGLEPADGLARSFALPGGRSAGVDAQLVMTALRLRDASGEPIGVACTIKPVAGMSVLGTMAALGDLGHLDRMGQIARAKRRPAAILFADLEASSPLARRLSTGSYFTLGRRLVRAADRCVVDAGGMVGRHVGDGVAAFFLAEHAGSESAAARACIAATRALREATVAVAARSDLRAEDVVLRFGLHWGATLHIGQITTAARAEVNGLGDEMNETARIEACATGGRALASKALVERLDPGDAAALGLELDRIQYTALADLATATDKARRDAPAIAVCEL